MTEPLKPGPLPATVYGLFYEEPSDDGSKGRYELFDDPAYTADQMHAYAAQEVAAAVAVERDRLAEKLRDKADEAEYVDPAIAAGLRDAANEILKATP